ncbi:hypothetical protein J6895_02472 [Nakaseomyces glabratus]|nr:hypothetical protein J6895_02472 [Nakaseomyces glabratus]
MSDAGDSKLAKEQSDASTGTCNGNGTGNGNGGSGTATANGTTTPTPTPTSIPTAAGSVTDVTATSSMVLAKLDDISSRLTMLESNFNNVFSKINDQNSMILDLKQNNSHAFLRLSSKVNKLETHVAALASNNPQSAFVTDLLNSITNVSSSYLRKMKHNGAENLNVQLSTHENGFVHPTPNDSPNMMGPIYYNQIETSKARGQLKSLNRKKTFTLNPNGIKKRRLGHHHGNSGSRSNNLNVTFDITGQVGQPGYDTSLNSATPNNHAMTPSNVISSSNSYSELQSLNGLQSNTTASDGRTLSPVNTVQALKTPYLTATNQHSLNHGSLNNYNLNFPQFLDNTNSVTLSRLGSSSPVEKRDGIVMSHSAPQLDNGSITYPDNRLHIRNQASQDILGGASQGQPQKINNIDEDGYQEDDEEEESELNKHKNKVGNLKYNTTLTDSHSINDDRKPTVNVYASTGHPVNNTKSEYLEDDESNDSDNSHETDEESEDEVEEYDEEDDMVNEEDRQPYSRKPKEPASERKRKKLRKINKYRNNVIEPRKKDDKEKDAQNSDLNYMLLKAPSSVKTIWEEYVNGIDGNPSIRGLEEKYGNKWRIKRNKKTFSRRKRLYKFILNGIDKGKTADEMIDMLEKQRLYRDENGEIKRRTIGWLQQSLIGI